MHQAIARNLKMSHNVNHDILSAVIARHKCDVVVSRQKITAWVNVFAYQPLKAVIQALKKTGN